MLRAVFHWLIKRIIYIASIIATIMVVFFLLDVSDFHDDINTMFPVVRPKANTANYILIMSQVWAPTICLQWLREDKEHACTITDDSWKMHGIWLSHKVEGSISDCNDTWMLDVEEIKPIASQLEKLWTNVKKDAAYYEFWEHEWLKHGTCSAFLEPLNTQRKYFEQGLKWIKEHSMTKALDKNGVLPSDDRGYNFHEIFKAISYNYEKTFQVVCLVVKNNQFVIDISICFNTNMEIADCVTNVRRPKHKKLNINGRFVLTNCDLSKEILYLRTIRNISRLLNILD